MPINELLARGIEPLDPAGAYRNALAVRGAESQLQDAQSMRQRRNVLQVREDEAYGQSQQDRAAQMSKAAQMEVFKAGLGLSDVPPEQLPAALSQTVAQLKAGPYGQHLAQLTDDPQAFQMFLQRTGIAQMTPEQKRRVQMKLETGIELPEPKMPEAYTLTPGSQRRGPNNELLAEAPREFAPTQPQQPPAGYRQTATGLEAIPGGPADPSNPLNTKKLDQPSGYTPKEISTARSKLLAIQVAQQQLNELKKTRDALLGEADTTGKRPGAISAGPFGAGMLPTESGKNFDAAVDQLRSSITGLKRVPGVGAMSDYETRLDQSMLPSRGEYESSIDQKIEGIQSFINQLAAGYGDIVGQENLPAPGQSAPQQSGVVRWGRDATGKPVRLP